MLTDAYQMLTEKLCESSVWSSLSDVGTLHGVYTDRDLVSTANLICGHMTGSQAQLLVALPMFCWHSESNLYKTLHESVKKYLQWKRPCYVPCAVLYWFKILSCLSDEPDKPFPTLENYDIFLYKLQEAQLKSTVIKSHMDSYFTLILTLTLFKKIFL